MKTILSIFLTALITALLAITPGLAQSDPIPPHDSLRLYSEILGEERVINVWMPPAYRENPSAHPVLYMPDGGIREDFPHIAHTLDSLVKSGRIPPLLLVGIENTLRGRDLTGASSVKAHEKYKIPMTDGASHFRAFITDELMPHINRLYPNSGTKGLIGESLAGLFVVETFLTGPHTFDYYIAMDPSLWWNHAFLVKNARQLIAKNLRKPTLLWFAGSNTRDISRHTKKLARQLDAIDRENLRWHYADKPREAHHTIFRATKVEALLWTFRQLSP